MSSIDSWRRKQQRKKRTALITIALVAVVALVAGFVWWNGSSDHAKKQSSSVTTMHNHDIGTGVSVSGEKVPSNIKAVAVKGEMPPLKHVVSVTPLIDFTPSGKLAAPLTLRFKLTKQVDPKDPNFVYATRETNKDPWEYIHATPTSDGHFVEVTVTHFSFGTVLHLSISPWENELVHNPFFNSDDTLDLQQEFKDNLTGGWTTKAEKPTCSNESQARQDDYVIDSEGKGTLYWCFGIENGKRVLKVVNRKHYPLDITHESMQVISAGHILVNLDQLARLTTGSNKHTVLFPGDTAVFSIDLKMSTLARLKTSYSLTSGGAASLGALQTAVLTVNSAAVTSKAPGAQKLSEQEAYKVMNYLLQSKDCYNAVASSNEADLTLDCIGAADPDKLSKVSPKLGAVGLLASFVKGVGSLGDKLRAIISGNIDSWNGEANYGIVIRRFDPITPYAGEWTKHELELKVSANGAGKLVYRNYSCPTMPSAQDEMVMCFISTNLQLKLQAGKVVAVVTSSKATMGTTTADQEPDTRAESQVEPGTVYQVKLYDNSNRLDIDVTPSQGGDTGYFKTCRVGSSANNCA